MKCHGIQMLTLCYINRQTIRRLQSPLAQKVRRIPARPPQKCRSKRRHQRPRHRQPDCQAHPGQPGAKAETSYIPCSRSCKFTPLPFLGSRCMGVAGMKSWDGIDDECVYRSIPTCRTPATSNSSSLKAKKSCRRVPKSLRSRRRG